MIRPYPSSRFSENDTSLGIHTSFVRILFEPICLNPNTSRAGWGWAVVSFALLLVLTGCRAQVEQPATVSPSAQQSPAQTTSPTPPDNSLAGTEWRLLAIQSMDDAVGVARPDDATRYTMKLNGDGTVQFSLNCNSANGKWNAKASSDQLSGTFEFSPLAATPALCPPPSLDERILAQSSYVRSFLIKDGRLNLSLMADGGILTWEQHPNVTYLTEPETDLEAAILRAVPSYAKEDVGAGGTERSARYIYGKVDLNNDGQDEVFAYLLGPFFCGTGGCNLLLFGKSGKEYTLINQFSTSRIPVIVTNERTRKWNNIILEKSGGGVPLAYLKQVFNGKRYVDDISLPGGQTPEGRKYLAGEINFEKAIPLQPQQAADGDAKVGNTPYHATGEIPCSLEVGQPTTTCSFGVIRRGNGTGSVTITKPDGSKRTIYFKNGNATGYDQSQADSSKFSAAKKADLYIIRIGTERYEVTEAVIFGG